MLALPILRVGSRDAAFVYGLVERGCFYDITLSYDEAFAQLRVGTDLIQRMLQEFAASGVHTMVSHGAHEYKRNWATTFLPSPRLFLFGRTPRGVATRAVRFGMAPVWRRLGAPEP
jgi:CelD/BcsL family acetyltransferase involved in cellulose biosynthesis